MYLNETVYPTSLLSLTESRHQKLSQLLRNYKINKKTHYFTLYDNLLSHHTQKKTVLRYKTVFFLAFEADQPSVIASLGQTCAQLPQLMQVSGSIL